MERRRPQLSSDELQRLRWTLGNLLALLAVSTVTLLDIDVGIPAGLAAAAALAALLRPGWPARLPPLVHRLAFPFVVAVFAWDLYSNGEWLPAVIRLDLWLLLYRSATYRRKRDDLQLIVLGLFLVMVAGVLSVSMAFAAQILGFTALTLAYLFAITLAEGMDAGRPAEPGRRPAWADVPWSRLARRLRAAADWRLLGLGAALFAGVVAVSALLFLSIPRFQIDSGLFLDRFITKKSHTGFSETIRLGEGIDIQQDNGVALRVDVSDASQVPDVPYWRMTALDEYRDGVFRTSRPLRADLVLHTQTVPLVRDRFRIPPGPPVLWTFYLEADVGRYLPIGGPFTMLRFREAQEVQALEALHVWTLRNEPVTMTAYRIEGMRDNGLLPDRRFGALLDAARAGPGWAAGGRYPATTLELPGRPQDRERLERWAREIAAGAQAGAAGFGAAAGRWLCERHGYSLRAASPPAGSDPVVAWLESGRPGHCELFAASAALLARAAGIPSRVAAGFKGGDWNGFENYFMVRNSHAHAWCELYDGHGNWVRIDPVAGAAGTPAAGAAARAGSARQGDRSWRARLDSVQILWYRRIVNFDQRAQVALAQSLRETAKGVGTRLREWVRASGARGWRWLRRPWDLSRFAGALAAAGAVPALWLAWRAGRARGWWRRAGGKPGAADPVRREAGRWLSRLSAGEGRETVPPETVLALQRLRYGPRGSWPEPRAVFRLAKRALREAKRGRSAVGSQ